MYIEREDGKVYVLDLKKLKEVCLSASMDGGGTKEMEISNAYEAQPDGELVLASKIEHETKLSGNPQNDMMIYDIVKLMVERLLNNADLDSFGDYLSFNTLVNWGIIIEVKRN